MSLSSATALMSTADMARWRQRERDAALVEAAGCLDSLYGWQGCDRRTGFHDPRCPLALAAKIRGQA